MVNPHTPRPRANTRPGVALIDALAAVIILGVSLSVILSLSGQAVASQRQGEELATAAMLADEQLQLVLAQGADDYAKSFPTAGQCDAPFENYNYKLDITEGGAINPFRVQVTITWQSAGRPQSATVQTLLASRSTPVNQLDRVPDSTIDRANPAPTPTTTPPSSTGSTGTGTGTGTAGGGARP